MEFYCDQLGGVNIPLILDIKNENFYVQNNCFVGMIWKQYISVMIKLLFSGSGTQSRKQTAFSMGCVFLGVSMMAGCAHQKTMLDPEPAMKPVPSDEMLQLQDEVKRLEGLLQEKDAIIRKQYAVQQSQVKEQQEASSEVTRVQTKLHRLATKPGAASIIAEVEVAMEDLKQNQSIINGDGLQLQAQRLLDAASASYDLEEYAAAMNYASQAQGFINMVADNNRKLPYAQRKTVSIHTPIVLQTVTDANLRRDPHRRSVILDMVKKGSHLITNAYRGDWFRVQVDDGRQGWVSNTLVITVVKDPVVSIRDE